MASDSHDPTKDLELVRRARAGQEAAITDLSQRLRCVPRILAARNRRMGHPLNEHDLADLGQDTVMVILRKLGEFAGRAPLEAWVYRVCQLEFLNGVRRKRRGPQELLEEGQIVDGSTTSDGLSGVLGDVERVHAALEKVGGVEAETIRMKHFQEMTFEEMGAALAMSPNTLKTRYYRGLQRVKRLLLRPEEDK